MKRGTVPYPNRRAAGGYLSELLREYAGRPDVVVLGLSRGGVPVAYEVARTLRAPLDVMVVRKLGLPGHSELAMGAIASGGVRVLNESVVNALQLSAAVIDTVAERENQELIRRERRYRGDRPPLELRGRVVILVDDGLATGSTMSAAVMAVRRWEPARIVVAVPVAARSACERFAREVDECVCAATPVDFVAVGMWYRDFLPIDDSEVCELLRPSRINEAGVTHVAG